MSPVIPPEGTYTETELRFIQSQPPGLWPENQNSNFGQLRKVLCDLIQARSDEIQRFSYERFVPTANDYLSLWEEMLGAPVAPTGKSIAQRRTVLESRLKYGAFTRAQRNSIIESFIVTTFGAPLILGLGVPLGAGIPLYGGFGSPATKYRVYEDPANFAYAVWIDTANIPDIGALTRELTRVTPAGIAFTIDTTHTGTGLINWANTVKNFAPSGWWKLDADYLDYSGLGHTGTVTGAPTAIAAPGLMLSAGTDGARDFSGTGQYVTISDSPRLNSPTFTIAASVRPDALPTTGQYYVAYAAGTDIHSPFIGIGNYGGTVGNRFMFRAGDATTGVTYEITGTITPVIGTTYRVAGVFDGKTAYLFVNGILEGQLNVPVVPFISGTKTIAGHQAGASWLWNGAIDEVAFFGYPLSDTDILYLSNQARNIL